MCPAQAGVQGVARWGRAGFAQGGRQGPERRIRVGAAGDFHQPGESQDGQAQEVGSQWTDLEEGGQSAQHCDRTRTTHDRTQERPKTQSGESREPQSLHITLRESTGPKMATDTEWRSCREQMSRAPTAHRQRTSTALRYRARVGF